MNKTLTDLIKLQETDDRLKFYKTAESEANGRLTNERLLLKEFEDRYASLVADIEAKKKLLGQLEAVAADLDAKKELNKKKQLQVRNENEHKALQKEADHLNANLSDTEDQILEIMDFLEKAEISRQDLEKEFGAKKQIFQIVSNEVKAALGEAAENSSSLIACREQLTASMEQLYLRQYEDLMKRRAGRAVSPAAGAMCLACSLSFPPQLFNELQKNAKICHCPNCSRILYWNEHPDFKKNE